MELRFMTVMVKIFGFIGGVNVAVVYNIIPGQPGAWRLIWK
jgi:hypothetical protein